MKRSKPSRVREPVQVYLDAPDRRLLDALAAESALSRAELLRLGLRRLSVDMLTGGRGGGVAALAGALDAAPNVPRDLAARHDDYLYGKPKKPSRVARRR